MQKAFKQALDEGLVEPVMNFNGGPLIINMDGKPVQYYQAADEGISMLMGRFYAFSDVLRKHDTLKLSDESLTAAMVTVRDLQRRAMAQVSIDVEQAMDCMRETLTLVERIQERRRLGLDLTQIYDIASIWFFSEDEDPGGVDTYLNRKKVDSWLNSDRSAELLFFFANTPIKKFVDLRGLLEVDTLLSIQQLNQLEMIDWSRTSVKRNQLGLTGDTISTTASRMETLFAFDTLSDLLLNPTTSSSAPGSESRTD